MKQRSIVRDILEQTLADAGFKRVGSYWRRESNDAHHIGYVQRSNFGAYYFLDLGIFFKALTKEPPKKLAGAHLQFRPGDSKGSWDPKTASLKSEVARYLRDYENIDDKERAAFIAGPMWQDAEATFDKYATIDRACKLASLPFEDRPLGDPRVHGDLTIYCGGEVDDESGR